MGLIAFAGAAMAGGLYFSRGGGASLRLSRLAHRSDETRRLVGIQGWLLLYLVGLGAELAHSLGLTIGSVVIDAKPSLVGLHSFIPLWAELIYVGSNLALIAYGVWLFVVMHAKRRTAIVNNIIFNTLSVAFLVSWFLLGAKSPVGTIVDALPGLAAIAYFSRSQRVRKTFVAL